jgi:8-oxo-dGTP pyrophosphatase MutT (NUDIX family)
MPREQSYGIIPLENRQGTWYVLLIQHGTAHYWGFPKGHPNPGETPKQTAERELFEETGLHVVDYLAEQLYTTRYEFVKQGNLINKFCGYFVAVVAGEMHIQKGEVADAKWVPLSEAAMDLTYSLDQDVVRLIRF